MPFLTRYIHSQDWVGLWYLAAKSNGANTTFTFGRRHELNHAYEVKRICHSEYDGIGFLTHWLEQEGAKVCSRRVAKVQKPLALRYNFHRLLGARRQLQRCTIAWRHSLKSDLAALSAEMEILFFSQEETSLISAHLVKHNISENSFLLTIINNFLLKNLKNNNDRGQWLFPVNMRWLVKRSPKVHNLSSAVYITTTNETNPAEIKAGIKSALANNEHWVNWWVLHTSIFLPQKLISQVSAKSAANSFFYGTFSNMGHWDGRDFESSMGKEDYSYFVAPPGTQNYPISVGVMTWFNKLTITLKIHPSILPDQSELRAYALQIRSEILCQVAKDSCLNR